MSLLASYPAHWRSMKLKYLASLKSGESITAEDITVEGPFAVYGGNGVRGYTTAFTHRGHFPLIGRQGALCGNVNYASGAFWASEHAVVVDSKGRADVRWLGGLLTSMNLNQYSQAAAQPGLAVDVVANLEIHVPPLAEQQAIAAFLDRETGRLDALVAAKQRLLEVLAEKRRALITHAVTRGLDPGAPLRDSGVPWLGQIPAHWAVRPLKYMVRMTSGATPPTDKEELWGGDVPWVSPKDMKREEIGDAEDHVSAAALESGPLRMIEPGAVLVVVRGMILAHSFPSAVSVKPVTINQDMKALHCDDRLSPTYLKCLFRGLEKVIVSFVDSAAHGTRKLESEVLGRFELCVPPLAEQQAIVAHINAQTARIDALRAATERTLELLKERRQALITAAVTGQLAIEEVAA